MANDDVLAELSHHLGRNFAGECARGFPVKILSAQADIGAGKQLGNRHERGEGRAQDALHIFDSLQSGELLYDQAARFGSGFVHFPVTSNKWCSHNDVPLRFIDLRKSGILNDFGFITHPLRQSRITGDRLE